ncbi:hypothetical protein [Polyangium mundeleinium]|uniref:Uncharacterized protein n=1 Tax=Polyangium mundeleinium TaxID=2995306 RepID=A0ABT5F8F6_9BACT|nr:hypothetical protein [Polyangium mundeleinium]MDC0749949.1 hypothetical protein [Polyangium mundeleinium]
MVPPSASRFSVPGVVVGAASVTDSVGGAAMAGCAVVNGPAMPIASLSPVTMLGTPAVGVVGVTASI